jgi:hypothetical protein
MNSRKWSILLVIGALVLASLACSFSASTASIAEAEMAKDEAGTQPTTVFAPEDIFYCNVELANAPDGTLVKSVWTAVDVEGADPNTPLDETEIESGSGTVHFNLSNSSAWPAGTYKVDLFLNDELDQTLEFTVE